MRNKSFATKFLLSFGIVGVSASAFVLTSCGGKANPFLELDPIDPTKNTILISTWEEHKDLEKVSETKLNYYPAQVVAVDDVAALDFTAIDAYWELAHFLAITVGELPNSTKDVNAKIDMVKFESDLSTFSAEISIPPLSFQHNIIKTVDLKPVAIDHRIYLQIDNAKSKFISFKYSNFRVI